MNKYTEIFKDKALIGFVTAGDPSLPLTAAWIRCMAASGVDLVEVGIPFSDPIAEGAVIQEASQRALLAGTTTDGVFDMLETLRMDCDVPLAIMTYVNVVFRYGAEKFLARCRTCGICCVILPDLPFEEKAELQPAFTAAGIEMISMLAPTSMERVSMIAGDADGFLYCVSSLGVTGIRQTLQTENLTEMIRRAKQVKEIPCAVGFGISTPEQVREIAPIADGVIVGSAIVKLIATHGAQSAPYLTEYIRSLKAALQD